MKVKYINREVSWLNFNARVLQEAMDERTPLIERIRFLAIFSNNLDEFFRVRVATVRRLVLLEKIEANEMPFNASKILKEINEIVIELQTQFNDTYKTIVQKLEKNHIYLVNEKQLCHTHGEFVKNYFHDKVRPKLFPIMLSNFKETSMLKDKSIYLAVYMSRKDKSVRDNFALIKVPTDSLSRFFILPNIGENKYIILLDDIIRYCLDDVFSIFNFDTFKAYTIKFTRDAELDIDNDVSKSFMELISESLKQRKLGRPVRFIYDKAIPPVILNILVRKFKIKKKDYLIPGDRYHNFKDFKSFPNVGSADFEYAPLPPLGNKYLAYTKSLLAAIHKKDIMLHFPYQSFHHIIDLLREASIDPNVKVIKMTLYRVAQNSNVINSLINAARNGKSVTVFMELQARFDERNNILWSEKMQEEGVKLIHGVPGLKVHSKLLLIRRKENSKMISYAYIGTGNFNEDTANVYTDDCLLTANQNIANEVDKVFNLFKNNYKPIKFKELVVSPFKTRDFFMRMIQNEVANARSGKPAWLIIKLNNLVDDTIVRKLYQASQAGVKIQLIVRGTCTLIPGVKGMSENIEVISIVDRFLEHSRVIVCCNDNTNKYYISSADWMQRNFDYRIEISCPIYDVDLQKEIMTMLNFQLTDNTKARIISQDKMNVYKNANPQMKVRSQESTYGYFKNILRERK